MPAKTMSSNPYESPGFINTEQTQRRRNWGRICLVALAIALVTGTLNFMIHGYFPDGGPSTPERRLAAGVRLLLLLSFYLSAVVAIVAFINWLRRFRR